MTTWARWWCYITIKRYAVGSNPTDVIFPLFSGKRKKEINFFASVRAGDVNGHDSLLLSTTVVRGEGGAPEIPVKKSVRVN